MPIADLDGSPQVLWEDGERLFCRAWRTGGDGNRSAVLVVLPAAEHPSRSSLDRLAHEYALKDELDGTWAVRPLELTRDGPRPMLVLEDSGGEALHRLLGAPMDVVRFLRLAIGIATALGELHRCGLVHKDIKPANILVNGTTGEVRLTGFGIASRLSRERQAAEPPETLAGTLAYMAPEQTGRMNRSVDSRSDLYALGVVLYEILIGTLPFSGTDPMDWVHCHLARTPPPPIDRRNDIPAVVSTIVMKLLAKTGEDRYQTAAGVTRDLRRCLAEWEARRKIDNFPLGESDTPDRLLIPEKLYGRQREIDTLLTSFDRVVNTGTIELVLVRGYSGIGKSSIVNELHKVLVPPRGLFASGKLDQHKRDIPYSTLGHVLLSLVRSLLGKSRQELNRWRDAFIEALGANGRLLVDIVPELALIVGEQPPVIDLPAKEAQRRFQLVMERFIGVFARPEHPLALFIDDMQWLDAATLDLLEHLLTQSDLRHLLLVGAYRDNEVNSNHPLARKLEAIKSAGAPLQEVTLAPLARDHLEQLIADTACCNPTRAAPLAQLVHEKTGGNPFFAIQFISALAEEALLVFDHRKSEWSWDLNRIHAKAYTENIVDLMVGKVARLKAETQKAVRVLACLGNAADIDMISIALEIPKERVEAALWEAVRQDFVQRLSRSYRFIHDRMQEAAYSLVPEALRATEHLRIGRLLATRIPASDVEEFIFEIVNQFNRGVKLIREKAECEQVAELNLIAGKRAKASTAYASALTYLTIGTTLLTEDCWERRHALIFALELARAECEFHTGDLLTAEQRLNMLLSRATSEAERATVVRLCANLYTAGGQNERAVSVGLDFLRLVGVDLPRYPTDDEARWEYDRICARLDSHTIEYLLALPLMADPKSLATIDVLTEMVHPTFFAEPNLCSLFLFRILQISLEQGNSEGTSAAFVLLGVIVNTRYADYRAAFRFGEIGYQLAERLGHTRFKHRAYLHFGGQLMPCARHLREGRDLLRRAFELSNMNGDLVYAGYSRATLIENLFMVGDPLADVEHEAVSALEFARKIRFGYAIDWLATQLGLVRTLRGATPRFGCLDDAQFDERRIELQFSNNQAHTQPECRYWICKLQALFLAGEYASALEASERAYRFLWALSSFPQRSDYHFFSALSHAACCRSATTEEGARHLEALVAHHQHIQAWAVDCPDNFAHREALISAEIARIENRDTEAMRLYDKAIHAAARNGFVQHEALSCELAAYFHAERNFTFISQAYLRRSRDCYLRWGANGKVKQLEQLFPELRDRTPLSGTTIINASVEQLDLATVIKVSQAVSGEMVLEKLIDRLMRAALEHAGAQRGILIVPRGDELQLQAEATASGENVIVHLRDGSCSAAALPETLVRYGTRTNETVILDDASSRHAFSADPYFLQSRVRSVLSLPLIDQGKLTGILYLENNLTPNVFTPDRVALLKMLASQAAISLENTRLYRDLAEREAKIRRLVDANIIGIVIFDFNGRVIEANDAFLRILGFDRDDFVSGHVRWTDLIPPEWRDRAAQTLREIRTIGTAQPFERDYFRKDGSKAPVLIGAASLEPNAAQGVAFVLDLTERKRAESQARESERRYRETQVELAHANRVATMGQLTASIAHEVSHPIGATILNAEAALRWLNRDAPDLDEARQLMARIIGDGRRAGNVVSRIRGLVKKASPRKEPLDMNEAIGEVIELARGESTKFGVAVKAQFSESLPAVTGDRTQLQQVMLNLVLNAVQAMSDGTPAMRELRISTQANSANGVLVSVRDSGPGIGPESLDRLFDPFYTTKSAGMGMGLAICRSIVEEHGGRIWATANIPRGAAFHFALPSAAKGSGFTFP